MAEAQYAMRLTKCLCGHEAIAHYDSHLFCTFTTDGECDCEEFRPAGPEVFVTSGPGSTAAPGASASSVYAEASGEGNGPGAGAALNPGPTSEGE